MAFLGILLIWTYAIGITTCPFWGWGDYMAEGLLITCTYNFLDPVSNLCAHNVQLTKAFNKQQREYCEFL